jgi:hypothetical protein
MGLPGLAQHVLWLADAGSQWLTGGGSLES